VFVAIFWIAAVTTCCHLQPQVEYAGPYPLDGAKVIEAAVTRQVGRPLRQAAALPGCQARWGCNLTLSVLEDGSRLKISVRNNTKPGSAAPSKAPGAAAAAKHMPGSNTEL
jgi:hypothetical protein